MCDWIIKNIDTIIDFFGFVAVIVTLVYTKQSVDGEKKAELADCIADYNFNFLASKELCKVERILESCYEQFNEKTIELLKENKKITDQNEMAKIRAVFFEIFEKARIITKKDAAGHYARSKDNNNPHCLSEEYQSIVNYLVYLEGFSALINQKIVKLADVDDLFGYRFFLAMNNPVIQDFELEKYKSYYMSCYSVYREWTQYRQKSGKEIPLNCFALVKE